MAHEPIVNGLRLGGLVEVFGLDEEQSREFEVDVNGKLGQIVSYSEELNKFHVYLICGVAGHFHPKNVRAAANCRKPGDGGAEDSFDILMGPKTDGTVLGSEIATCLFEKGFCVVKICQSSKLIEKTVDRLRGMGDDGKLARLPEEVEEGYLGINCRGKVIWLNYEDKELAADENLVSNDGNLSYIAQVFQPFSLDLLDDWIDERSPALVCLTLTDEEEPEYPFPEADDAVLGTFLTTWRRGLVRAVHFMGPSTASVTLDAKDSPSASKLPNLQGSITLTAGPGTILLFRPDVYEYTCDAQEETLMLVTNFLSPAPQMVFSQVEGDLSWLSKAIEGPPPPPGDENVYVVNSVSRLPGNWDNQWAYFTGLKAGTDTVIEIPISRYDIGIYYTADENNFEPWQSTTKHQSYCEGVELFDNRHFEISNAEAAGMDPVQRLLLECGAMSLAMVGLTKKVTNRRPTHAGFCVGNDKLDWQTCPKSCEIGAAAGGTSTVLAIIANRFSFVFNLKGPNFVCDTACSASLTSTHCAKLMIRERRFDPLEFFLTMGAHLCLSPGGFIGCSQSHMSSPTGRCFTFNSSANGYLRGEGVSGFMMKWGNFKDDSDAILRATQVGQDGRSASLTAPNGPAQEEMVSRAIKEAQMTPPESTVWECHGTGTSLGDPIEVGAVRKVQIRMPRSEPLMLASNKTNIGHLEGGAAMAGMCKSILQCKHATCASTLHLRTLNPHLEHAAFDAIFQSEVGSFAYCQGHCQISSFGFGGTNAHGIFWGQNPDVRPDLDKLWMKKLQSRPPPEVRPMGKNPDDWEADFPDPRSLKRGARYALSMGPDDPPDQPIRWELVDDGGDEFLEDEDASFAVSGNFNDWSEDRMAAGDVPGLHTARVEVPSTGVLEFHFLKDGDKDQVICPAAPVCTRKTEAIIGPSPELTNKWVVHAPPSKEVRIEFFSKRGRKSVMWLVESG